MVKPNEITVGQEVIFHPSPRLAFRATVASEPWKLGGHTWVVRLENLPASYAEQTRKSHSRTHVPSAALFAIDLLNFLTGTGQDEGGEPMQCCGQEVTTPFCPLCGKKAVNIQGLLNHVNHCIECQSSFIRNHKNDESWLGKGTERRKQTLAKWQTWEVELVELIEKAAKWDKHLEESDNVG